MAGTKKLTPPETEKSVKKTVVKKAHQQKRAASLTEEIEKEIVRVADGFLEKAARSRVKCEKEIEQQVLGNEGMAAHSSAAVERERLENLSGNKEKAARSKVRFEKEIERQMLGNEGMARTQAQQLKGKGWKMCLEARKRLHVQK